MAPGVTSSTTTIRFFTSLKKLEPLRWTSHMDECLRVLEEQAESDSDISLAALVKLQLITEQIHRAPWQNGDSSNVRVQVLPPAYLNSVMAQLRRVRNELPAGLQNNGWWLALLSNETT